MTNEERAEIQSILEGIKRTLDLDNRLPQLEATSKKALLELELLATSSRLELLLLKEVDNAVSSSGVSKKAPVRTTS